MNRRNRPIDFAAILIFLLLFLFASPASADNCLGAELCSLSINRGDAAPFTGQIMTTELAITLGQRADRCDAVTAIAVRHAEHNAAIDLREQVRINLIDREAWDQKAKAYERKLATDSSFWSSRDFGIVLGIVGSVVAIVLANQLRDGVSR